MKEGKSKVVKRESTGKPYESPNGTLYGFNMEFEDGQTGLYNSKSQTPNKFNVGEVWEYTAEEKTGKSGSSFFIIKPKMENKFGGGFKRPSNEFALEQARKMYNSTNSIEHPNSNPWDLTKMTNTATWLLKLLNGGTNKAAIETACTNACASAMQGKEIIPKELSEQITLFNDWLKNNQ